MNDESRGGGPGELPEELLGVHALDAVDDMERRRVERAVATDAELASEADRLRRAVDALADAAAEDAAPAGQWARLESAIRAVGPVPQTTGPAARPGGLGRTRWVRPMLAAAAVVMVFVLGAGVVIGTRSSDDRGGEFASDPVGSMTAIAQQTATQPGSRTGVLTDPGHSMSIDVVVDSAGHGFLMTAALPSLPPDETYQLWSAHGDTMVSLGMLGPDPTMAVVSVDAAVTDLALTREPIGGSVAPSGAPMATGHLV